MSITTDEFNAAVRACGFRAPSADVADHLINSTRHFSRGELAMFLAQLIHESGGFQFKEELAYKNKPNHGKYVDKVGLPGKDYHGRGYIQLTWGANYKAASQALGLGDQLLKNPETVASDTGLAMQVSVWYWEARVRPMLAGKSDLFGVTTKAINPGECRTVNERARKRYQYYVKVADVMGIADKAKENGCYN